MMAAVIFAYDQRQDTVQRTQQANIPTPTFLSSSSAISTDIC